MKKLIINRNEMIAGPSPACIKVVRRFNKEHFFRYLDGYYQSPLATKISKIFQIPEQDVVLSYGSELLLSSIFNYATGGSVLTHDYYYSFYDKYLPDHNIPYYTFKNEESNQKFIFDIEDCIQKYIKYKPKVLVITSPNNPTGNTITLEGLKKILKNVSDKCLVVIDQAYWGVDEDYNDKLFLSLLDKHKNLMFIRSFSKLYALAGLRIAFGLCGKNVRKKLNYSQPYLGFSRILEEVGMAALDSNKYYEKKVKEIILDRKYFVNQINKLHNFKAYESKATFVLVRVSDCAKVVLEDAVSREKFNIMKFVSSNLMRVSLDPKKYTKKFLCIIKRVDEELNA